LGEYEGISEEEIELKREAISARFKVYEPELEDIPELRDRVIRLMVRTATGQLLYTNPIPDWAIDEYLWRYRAYLDGYGEIPPFPSPTPNIDPFDILGSIKSAVWGVISSFFETVKRDIVDPIIDKLTGILNAIGSAIWNALQPVRNAIDAVKSAFWNALMSAKDAVWNGLVSVWNTLRSVGERIWGGLSWLGGQIWNVLQGLGKWIWDGLNWIWNGLKWVGQQIWNGLTNFYNALVNLPNMIWNAITGLGNRVWSAITGIGVFFNNLGQRIWSSLSEFARWIWQNVKTGWDILVAEFQKFINWIWNEFLVPAGMYIGERIKGVFDGITSLFDTLIHNVLDTLFRHSPHGPEEAWNSAIRTILISLGIGGAMTGLAFAIEALHPIKNMGLQRAVKNLLDIVGIPALVSSLMTVAINAAYSTPLRQFFNGMFTPNIPSEGDLSEFLRKGLIDEPFFYEGMRLHGFKKEYADLYREAARYHFRPEEAIRMWWRGLIDEAYADKELMWAGMRENQIQIYKQFMEYIPPISDLIRFAVREAYPVEGPEAQKQELIKWGKAQGLNEYWVERYWIAHWELPAFSQIREAFWRKIISEQEFRSYIVMHDYRPDPWPGHSKSDLDVMFELSFELPGRIDTRWMYEWGIINKDQAVELLKMSGLHPDWAPKVADAYLKNQIRDEFNRIKSELIDMYAEGFKKEEDIRRLMADAGRPDVEMQWTLEYARLRRERYIKKEMVKIYLEAFEKGRLDEDGLRESLRSIPMDEDVVEYLIELEKLKLTPRPRTKRS
jgi:hypothetical protein